MKLLIATYNYKDRIIVETIAYLLEDIIEAVEKGKTTIVKNNKILN